MSANLTTTQSSTSASPTTADISTTIQLSTETTSSSASFSSTPLETTVLSTNQRTTADSPPTENQPDMKSSTPLTLSSIVTTWDTTTKQQGATTNERKIFEIMIFISYMHKETSLILLIIFLLSSNLQKVSQVIFRLQLKILMRHDQQKTCRPKSANQQCRKKL